MKQSARRRSLVFLNGRFVPENEATVSVMDHGFLYGDGVYETLRVYDGCVFSLDRHLRRLARSARGIRLRVPMSGPALARAIRRTVRLNGHREAVVRVTITRGPGPLGFDPRPCRHPTVVVQSRLFRPYPERFYRRGIAAAIVSVRRNSPASLPPEVKSTSCLNGILAKAEAIRLGADEGIMLSLDGSVAEGTVSNVFLVKGNRLKTPRLEGNLLAGVTREWVLRLARRSGLECFEDKIRWKDLLSADEVFLTNTTMEVMPVTRLVVSGPPVRRFRIGAGTVGPLSRRLRELFLRHALPVHRDRLFSSETAAGKKC